MGCAWLSLTGLLVGTADDLDFVSFEGALVIELEVDILDQEGPHVVAESVSIEMTL